MFLDAPAMKKNMPQITNSYQEQSIIQVLAADTMLSHVQVQKKLKQLEQLVNIPADYFRETYLNLIASFADYVQVIPVVEGGQLGGLFDEGLSRALLAIQLQKAEGNIDEPVVTFALFSAALLLDLRKLYVNKKIQIVDEKGAYISDWSPFEGTLQDFGSYYRIRLFHRPMMQLSPYLTVLLARQVMPNSAFLWLSEDLRWLNMWLAALCGDEEGAGGLGHFLNLAKRQILQLEKKPRFVVPVEITRPRELELGEAFWGWLKKIVLENDISQPVTSIHLVDEGIFLEVPKVFEDFAAYAKLSDWNIAYRQFMKLGIAATNQTNDINAPEQLFIYLNKDDISAQRIVKQNLDAKNNLASTFFNQAIEKQAGNLKAQEQVQDSYHVQGLMIHRKEWFLKSWKKNEINKQLKVLVTKEREAQKFRGLEVDKKPVIVKPKLTSRW